MKSNTDRAAGRRLLLGAACGLTASLLGTAAHAEKRESGKVVEHADILQALAITTAVRNAEADVAATPGVDFSLELIDVEVSSDYEVATYAS